MKADLSGKKKSITGNEVGYVGLYEMHGKFLSRYLGEQLSEINIWFTGKSIICL